MHIEYTVWIDVKLLIKQIDHSLVLQNKELLKQLKIHTREIIAIAFLLIFKFC